MFQKYVDPGQLQLVTGVPGFCVRSAKLPAPSMAVSTDLAIPSSSQISSIVDYIFCWVWDLSCHCKFLSDIKDVVVTSLPAIGVFASNDRQNGCDLSLSKFLL